jgi:hypothetical protein
MFTKDLFFLIVLTLHPMEAFSFDLMLSLDGDVQNLVTGEKKSVSKDEKLLILDRQPRLIESPGRIPVLLVPVSSDGGAITVNSPSTMDMIKEAKDLKIDNELSEVLLKLGEIQFLMAQKKLSIAQQKISELKTQFPNVRYLDFFDASIAFLLGDRTRALASVTTGLKAHPDYSPGLKLQESLGSTEKSNTKKKIEDQP